MTALERIKEIENEYMHGSGLVEDEETEFLLKALKVMEELAVRVWSDGKRSDKIEAGRRELHEEFEKRMSDKD